MGCRLNGGAGNATQGVLQGLGTNLFLHANGRRRTGAASYIPDAFS